MPATVAGKAIAARNATTHGVFSQEIVLSHLGEDPAEFDSLLENLQNELRPHTLVQQHQVRQIAQALWRLRRLEAWEGRIMADAEATDAQKQAQWERALKLDNMLRRQIDRAYRLLQTERAKTDQNELRAQQWQWDKELWAERNAARPAVVTAPERGAEAVRPAAELKREAVSIAALRRARRDKAQGRKLPEGRNAAVSIPRSHYTLAA